MRFNGMAGMVEERHVLPSSWFEMISPWGRGGRGGSKRMHSHQTIEGEPDSNTAPQLHRLYATTEKKVPPPWKYGVLGPPGNSALEGPANFLRRHQQPLNRQAK
ncbi:hypothetical protein ABZZ20_09720 [Streptomyces sp. NPDC006430]|uniref:hypothetical protein n=1 Tax=Streptomyces sp. NPDC006430 TaxID=3154299 RepID=UPI0033B13A3C